jgi:hypothetical protein
MATPSDHDSHEIDYDAMWEVLWMSVPPLALVGFVLWLMISQSIT